MGPQKRFLLDMAGLLPRLGPTSHHSTTMVPLVFILCFVVIPYVAIGAALIALIRKAYLFQGPSRPLWLYPLVGTFLSTAGFVAWGVYSIRTSHSSTAGIGFIFLPIYTVAFTVLSFLGWGAAVYIVRFILERLGQATARVTSAVPMLISVVLLSLMGANIQHTFARNRLLAQVKSGPFSESTLDQALSTHDTKILAELAKNPNTPEPALRRIFEAVKGEIDAANSRASAVFQAVASNGRTSPDILVALSHCQASSVRVSVGTNPNTPVEVLPLLAEDKNAQVRTWVTNNPKLSQELLQKLAGDNEITVRNFAQTNLRRRERLESPGELLSPETQKMIELGRRAALGELGAVDEMEKKRSELYQGIDYQKERDRVIANLKLMRAAFDLLGKEAGKNSEAMKALEYANTIPGLRSFTVDSYGLAAAAGNQQALEALLHYQSQGWLLSTTVSAMGHPAGKNQAQAVDFLVAVLSEPKNRALHHMASLGLKSAAAAGNEKAGAALEEAAKQANGAR